MCTLSDCYGSALGGEVGRNANIIQITAIVCYILLYIRLRTIDKKNTSGAFRHTNSYSEASLGAGMHSEKYCRTFSPSEKTVGKRGLHSQNC